TVAGLGKIPRFYPALALILAVGTLTAAPLTKSVNYRRISAEMRKDCPNCPILVGAGYAGAVPACLLYESKESRIVRVRDGDSVEELLGRIGRVDRVVLVPTPNEPTPDKVESELVARYPSIRKDNYYEILLDCPTCMDSESVEVRNHAGSTN